MRDLIWAKGYARRALLKRYFASWKKKNVSSKKLLPITNGLSVYVLFKWITLVFDSANVRQYHFPFHALTFGSQDGALFISRIRRQVVEACQVNPKHLPLFVHGIAILDAYILGKIFFVWKERYVRHKQLDDYAQFNYARCLLRRWKQLHARKQLLKNNHLACSYTSNMRVLQRIFGLWKDEKRYSQNYRVKFLTRHLYRNYRNFVRSIQEGRVQKVQIQVAFKHYVTVLLQRSMHSWKRQLCYLAQSQTLIHTPVMLSLINEAAKSTNKLKLSHTVLPSGLCKVVSMWQVRRASSVAQRCLCEFAHRMHTKRRIYACLRRMRSHAYKLQYSSAQLHKATAHHYKHAVRFAFAHIMRQYLTKSLRKRAFITLSEKRSRATSMHVFGHWLLLCARRRQLHRSYHRVFARRLHRLLVLVWGRWRDRYTRMHMVKTHQLQLLQQHTQDIENFSRYIQHKHAVHTTGNVLRRWYIYTQDATRGRKVQQVFARIQAKLSLVRRMEHWKTYTNLSVIATCIQKLYRGYRCRFTSHYRRYRYLQYVRKVMPQVVSFRKRWCRYHGWCMWKEYQKKFVVFPQRQNVLKSIYKYYYGKLRFHHAARRQRQTTYLMFDKYHMNMYYRQLFQRLRDLTRRRRQVRMLVYAHYQRKMRRCLRQLRTQAALLRHKHQSLHLLFARHFQSFRQRIARIRNDNLLDRYQMQLAQNHFVYQFYQSLRTRAMNNLKARKFRAASLLKRRRRVYFKKWRRSIEHNKVDNSIISDARAHHHRTRLLDAVWRMCMYRHNFYNARLRQWGSMASSRHAGTVVEKKVPSLYNRLFYRNIKYYLRKWRRYLQGRQEHRIYVQQKYRRHVMGRKRMAWKVWYVHYIRSKMKHAYRHPNQPFQHRHQRVLPLTYTLTSKLMYTQVPRGRLQGILRNDLLPLSHLLVFLYKWRVFVQKTRRNKKVLVRKINSFLLGQKLHRCVQRWVTFARKRRRYAQLAKIASDQHVSSQMSQVVAKLKQSLRRNRRVSRKLMLFQHQQQISQKKSALFSFQKLLRRARFNTYCRARLRYVSRLLSSARDFYRRLHARITRKIRYGKVRVKVSRRFQRYLHRRFQRFRARLLAMKRQRLICAMTLQSHQKQVLKQIVRGMWLKYIYKKKLARLVRRLSMVPVWKTWRNVFTDTVNTNRAVRHMHLFRSHLTKSRVFDVWKITTYKEMRYKIYTHMIESKRIRRTKQRTLQAMLQYIDRKYLFALYAQLSQKHSRNLQKMYIRRWFETYRRHHSITLHNVRNTLSYWKLLVDNRQVYRRQKRIAEKFHVNRGVYRCLLLWNAHVARLRRIKQRLQAHARRRAKKMCRLLLERWKRFMYTQYYVHKVKGKNKSIGRGFGVREMLRDDHDMYNDSFMSPTKLAPQRAYSPSPGLFRTHHNPPTHAHSPVRASAHAHIYHTHNTRRHPHLQHSAPGSLSANPYSLHTRHLHAYREQLKHKYFSLHRRRSYSRVLPPYAHQTLHAPTHILQALRCLRRWRRISTNYNQYRQDMNVYHLFKQWRAVTTTITYKRLAFVQRLRTLYQHTLYRSIYDVLHKNYIVMVRMRQLTNAHRQTIKKRCMDYLLSRYRCRIEVKNHMHKLLQTIYNRHKYTLWCVWKVKGMGHTHRLLQTSLLKLTMMHWKNAYTARRYHQLVTYRKIMVMWKLRIHMQKVMVCYLQHRRHVLFKVMSKYFIQPSNIHMRCAWMVWKMNGVSNPTIPLREYMKKYEHTSHTLSYAPSQSHVALSMPIHIHDGLLYDEWQMRRQLGNSQAASLLLFEEEDGVVYDSREGHELNKPRYEVILQRMKDTYRSQKTSLAMLDVYDEEDGDEGKSSQLRSSSRLPSLRQAMYNVVQQRQKDAETPIRRSRYIGTHTKRKVEAPSVGKGWISPVSEEKAESSNPFSPFGARSRSRLHVSDIL